MKGNKDILFSKCLEKHEAKQICLKYASHYTCHPHPENGSVVIFSNIRIPYCDRLCIS